MPRIRLGIRRRTAIRAWLATVVARLIVDGGQAASSMSAGYDGGNASSTMSPGIDGGSA